MPQLELDEKEQETLTVVLESYLSELQTEISHTDRQALREQLRGQERVVKQIQDRLVHAVV